MERRQRLSRRAFASAGLGLGVLGASLRGAVPGSGRRSVVSRDRVLGLVVGTLIGDALGGPVEFQPPDKVHGLPGGPKAWSAGERLDAGAIDAAAARVRLRGYGELRPEPEPYAHWTPRAGPGTVTDDSRHKMILMAALRRWRGWRRRAMGVEDLARTYLDWPAARVLRRHPGYVALNRAWIPEWQMGARWVLGERREDRALPPGRMWAGLPTCCGQMTLPPLAALFPGRPDEAYRAAYHLGFFDNGFGKDLNAALVAGLAEALVIPDGTAPVAAWARVRETMRRTDPYRYAAIPFTPRPVDRWMDVALRAAKDAMGCPQAMFDVLNQQFRDTIKWEAQVPFAVVFAVTELAMGDPLASLQLSIEWGHDTDSYAQLLGAFVGGLHGAGIFPRPAVEQVRVRLQEDYDEDLDEWVDLLVELGALGEGRFPVQLQAGRA